MISLTPITDLDGNAVLQTRAEIQQRVQDDNARIDVSIPGVFGELLAHYYAVLDTQRRTNINDYLNGRSLLAMEQDSSLADPDLVDDVMSNFRVTRKPGRKATGDAIVVVSDDTTVTVAQGSVWEANGQRYVAPQVFTAKAEQAQVVADGDRLLTPAGTGRFTFVITLEAEEEGPDFAVTKDSLIVPLVAPINYITSYAATDFTQGLNPETNAEILVRLQEGIAAKAMSNRTNMTAMLRAVDAYSRVVAQSIVGYGDAEQLRGQHTVLPIAFPGRVDWYVRTQERVFRKTLDVTAKLVAKDVENRGVWQFSLDRDAYPGFYDVTAIRRANVDPSTVTGSYAVTSDIRSYDITGTGFLPDVTNATEAAYSRFSTATIRFTDTDTDVADMDLLTELEYSVEVRGLPLISEIQEFVSSRDVRSHGADCLIKAPVPCFVSLGLTIYKRAGEADPDVEAMKVAMAATINRIGFVGRLMVSQLYEVAYGYLRSGQVCADLDLLGRVRYPDGTTERFLTGGELKVPDEPGAMVSARTVQFFADPEDITITVTTAVPSDT